MTTVTPTFVSGAEVIWPSILRTSLELDSLWPPSTPMLLTREIGIVNGSCVCYVSCVQW
jgi:hypothetical protein